MRLSLILLFLQIWGAVDVSLSQDTCSSLPNVPHASVSERSKKTEYAQGDVVYFTCETGYIAGPTITYNCTSQGWEVIRPGPCYLKPCGLPDSTPDGYYELIHGEDFVFGAIVRYFCNEGYYMVSKRDTRSCLLNTWSNHVPVCEPTSCEPPPTDLGLTVRGLSESDDFIPAGRLLTFSCDEPGKALNDSTQLICGKDGQWSHPFPSCEDISCKAAPADTHLYITGLTSANELMKIGHKLQFSCDQGYLLEGSEELECLESGQWNKPFPTCFEGCQVPGQAGAVQRKLRKGEKLTFHCKVGLFLHGNAELECLAKGQWSGDIPTCSAVPLGCGRPPHLQDGDTLSRMKWKYNHGDRVEYTCQRYFVLGPVTHTTCVNGNWMGEVKCFKPCPVSAAFMRQRFIEFKVRNSVIEYVPHNDHVRFVCMRRKVHITGNMYQVCVDGAIDMPTCI